MTAIPPSLAIYTELNEYRKATLYFVGIIEGS